nr:mitochondrial ribosome-associated GTPase 2-like [Macaca nemestrina]
MGAACEFRVKLFRNLPKYLPNTYGWAMSPARLFSARLRTVFEDVGHWALSTRAGLKPSRRLPQQASPRLLSVGCADHAKRQELPGKKPLSEKKLKRYFVDCRRVLVCGGNGGAGASCFHSEPRKEFGGPDGGDGGNGGHVILRGRCPGAVRAGLGRG